VANFITRVELHGATYEDYETLHKAMEREKFARTIAGEGGVVYQLPTAEYSSHGNLSASDVRLLAERAAAQTGRSYCILVTEGTSAWRLQPASQPSHLRRASV
jgi:hypothetical protein